MSSVAETLFTTNHTQAVRVAKALAFPPHIREVEITREGDRLTIEPAGSFWERFFDAPGIDLEQPADPLFPASEPLGMVSYLLDTNMLVRALRGRASPLRRKLGDSAAACAISPIVAMELLHGTAKSDRSAENRRKVLSLMEQFVMLPFDLAAANAAADIRATLDRTGMVIGANNLMIAGHARSQGLIVITGNLGEFHRVDRLRCEDWID